jgi:hypothetical protein
LKDPLENMGAQMVKPQNQWLAGRWNYNCNRFSTSYCKEGLKNVAAGANQWIWNVVSTRQFIVTDLQNNQKLWVQTQTKSNKSLYFS